METCLFVIALALLWLFRESDWLRLRMVVGAVVTSCPWAPHPTHRLCYQWFDRDGKPTNAAGQGSITLTRENFKGYPFSPGIDTPLCGWEWIEGRPHPRADYRITIVAWGITHRIALANDNPTAMKTLFTAALKPNREQRKALTQHKAAVKRAHKASQLAPAFAS